jgi:hypothetical protein
LKADLLKSALELILKTQDESDESDMRRALSAAYYSVFHAISESNANCVVGERTDRNSETWLHCYRALEHKQIRSLARRQDLPEDLKELRGFIDNAEELQEFRHSADYDPTYRISRTDALAAVEMAAEAIAILDAVDVASRRALAVQMLLLQRRN